MEIKILLGTETGNSEEAANSIANKLNDSGFTTKVIDMGSSSLEDIKSSEVTLIVTSTWGDGDAPSNAQDLLDNLNAENNSTLLSGIKYSVFALGDQMYPNFCQAGIDFDTALGKLGAERLLEVIKNEDDFLDNIPSWTENIINKLK